ncbi:MAG: hypothetical protein FWF20_11995 [Betaproteobacteria bacterium]|nr:hypothetical protein [Betaproteobacteria bacterium]
MTYRIPDKTYELLNNWKRWCWLGELPRAMRPPFYWGVNWGFRSPGEYDMDVANAPPPAPKPVDEESAKRVQARWEMLPDAPRLVLMHEFPARDYRTREEVARALGMGMRAYETHLAYAIARIEKEFYGEVCA